MCDAKNRGLLRQECVFTQESSEHEASFAGKGLHTPADV